MSQVFEEKDRVELLVSGEIPLEELGGEWLSFIEPGNLVAAPWGRYRVRVVIGVAGTPEEVIAQLEDLANKGFTRVKIQKVVEGEEPAYRLGDVPVYA